ncbi:MAG: YihY/virulence factor BrkB family protein [Candidatus Rokuibacteriota bacterium]
MLGFRGAVARFLGESGFFLAAGLAFFFLVCVVPLLLLGASTLGFVLSSQEAAQGAVNQLTRNFPVYRREITGAILRIIETRALSGIAGTLALVFFSTPLFGATRLVLHRMLGVRAGGGYVSNLLLDTGMVLLLTVLLFASSTATWLFHTYQELIPKPLPAASRWTHTVPIAFSVTLSTMMFYLGYRYVPRRRPRVGAALVGALLAAVLWEVAKQLFRLYIRNVGVYDQIYGPLGVLVAFVMFVYYSAIVFVFGAAYVASLDSRRR